MNNPSEWLQPYLVWFVVGIVMLLLETAAPGLIIAFFGVGAILVGTLCLFLDLSLNAQLAIFIASSLLLLILLRKYLKSVFTGHVNAKQEADQELQEFVGDKAVVIKEIKGGMKGRVELRGTQWDAEAAEDIAEGAMVEITGKDSITLKVKAIN